MRPGQKEMVDWQADQHVKRGIKQVDRAPGHDLQQRSGQRPENSRGETGNQRDVRDRPSGVTAGDLHSGSKRRLVQDQRGDNLGRQNSGGKAGLARNRRHGGQRGGSAQRAHRHGATRPGGIQPAAKAGCAQSADEQGHREPEKQALHRHREIRCQCRRGHAQRVVERAIANSLGQAKPHRQPPANTARHSHPALPRVCLAE